MTQVKNRYGELYREILQGASFFPKATKPPSVERKEMQACHLLKSTDQCLCGLHPVELGP